MSKELSKFIEPTVILTLSIGIAYFLGWIYTDNYFKQLGIQLESLNVPAAYYLSNVAIIGFVLLVSIIVVYNDKTKNQLLNIRNHKHSTELTILFILLTFMTVTLLSSVIASNNAQILVAGAAEDTFLINFSWKEESPKEIEGKELILVIYNDNKYYVVAKQKPASDNPEIYIIPDDQIEFAVTKRINSTLRQRLSNVWEYILP